MKIVGLLCAGAIAFGAVIAAASPAATASDDENSKPVASGKIVKHKHLQHLRTKHLHTKHLRTHARIYPENSSGAARRAYYRSLEPYRSMDFRGEFPGNCAVQRAAGQCMIDLGYGRCESCNVGGPP
ncbi:MAG: hypothetical protein ACREPW_09245 [Candidatus Binataceae bacterium]